MSELHSQTNRTGALKNITLALPGPSPKVLTDFPSVGQTCCAVSHLESLQFSGFAAFSAEETLTHSDICRISPDYGSSGEKFQVVT